MHKTSVIFDFDGTLANSITVGFKLANIIIEKLGMAAITDDEFALLRNKSYKDIIKAYNIPLWQIPKLLLQLRNSVKKNLDQVHPFPGIASLLHSLEAENMRLFVLTSNSRDIVSSFLERHEITVFEDIYSEKNIFGKAKAIERFLKLQKLSKEEVLYVGDEVRDAEACNSIGVDCVSVTWGFNAREILEQHNPRYIADTPQDLHKIIKTLQKN